MEKLVFLEKGQPVTDSLMVAEVYGRRHADVLRSIYNLRVSREFIELNFILSEYEDITGKRNRKYFITLEGFNLLTLGFTGKAAAKHKERYIREFMNPLESTDINDLPKILGSSSQKEQPKTIPLYDVYQPWAFKPNPHYVSTTFDFPTKDVLLQAVGNIGAIEHEQMVDLFGVQQERIHSMICSGELVAHELWLDTQKQTVYTLGLRGCELTGHKPEQIEYWSIPDLLEKLVFFEFFKHLQATLPERSFEIKQGKSPFTGRISNYGEDHKVLVLQHSISQFEAPEDDDTPIYVLLAREAYAAPLEQQYGRAVYYIFDSFMPTTFSQTVTAIQKTNPDPFAFLNNLP